MPTIIFQLKIRHKITLLEKLVEKRGNYAAFQIFKGILSINMLVCSHSTDLHFTFGLLGNQSDT